MDLALILKEKLAITGVHQADMDLEVVGKDPGNFSSPTRPLEVLKITWTESDEQQWAR